jgi:hypothetical protein
LSLQKCKLKFLQWFRQEDDSWEAEHCIRDSVHYPGFWAEIKGKKSGIKIGQQKQAPDGRIREFISYLTCCYLIRINLVQWQEEFLSCQFVGKQIDNPAPNPDVPAVPAPPKAPCFIGKHLKGW